MIAFDTTQPAKPKNTPFKGGPFLGVPGLKPNEQTVPASPPEAPMPIPSTGAGMIFLRRDDRGWWCRFFGIVGLGANELPLPGDRTAKVGDLLAYLKVQHGNKLSGAWILIAP